jgi:chromosome segregation ATPase
MKLQETKEFKAAQADLKQERLVYDEAQACRNKLKELQGDIEGLLITKDEIMAKIPSGEAYASDLRGVEKRIEEVRKEQLDVSDKLEAAQSQIKRLGQNTDSRKRARVKCHEIVLPLAERVKAIDAERAELIDSITGEIDTLRTVCRDVRGAFPTDRRRDGFFYSYKMQETLNEDDFQFINQLKPKGETK